VVHRRAPLGFSRATNLGLDDGDSQLVATINDDVVLDEGWLAALRAALLADESVAAVQGTNVDLHQPMLVDGRGLRWNRWWQAVQIDHGATAPTHGPPREVFGVSATAALYRRRALLEVALDGTTVFDPDLDSYYEDVDLACRLRSAGRAALCVPTARARHAGSTSSAGWERLPLVYGNRYLVAARFLGRAFWARLPLFVLRDLLDVLSPAAHLDRRLLAGAVIRGWRRAASRLGAYGHLGRPGMRPALAHPRPVRS
jgi:GT2 family glycosyltransferase